MADPHQDGVSPDSVACFDLVETTTNDNLESVRKRLKSSEAPTKVKAEPKDCDDRKRAALDSWRNPAHEVQVVPNPASMIQNDTMIIEGNADDCAVVGTKNCVRLPHMRQHCTEKPFENNPHVRTRQATNASFCDLCYCYVCDVPVKECTTYWNVGEMHCLATDQGPDAFHWKMLRQVAKPKPSAAASTETLPTIDPNGQLHLRCACPLNEFSKEPDPNDDDYSPWLFERLLAQDVALNLRKCPHCICFVCEKPASECTRWAFGGGIGSTFHCNAYDTPEWERARQRTAVEDLGPGPFAPDDETATRRDKTLQRCSHCGWQSRFSKHQGYLDEWCHACGRVAQQKASPSQQSVPFTNPCKGQILLGTKEIPFTLHAHDPRQMKAYEKMWAEHSSGTAATPGWTFDESVQRKELFHHRFGARPTLNSILAGIPIVEQNQIPVDGTTTSFASDLHSFFRDETDALLLESPNDLILLKEVARNAPTFALHEQTWRRVGVVDGDLEATWDSETDTGIIRLRVFVNDVPTYESGSHTPTGLTRFLGTWFGILPFKLSDLFLNLKAQAHTVSDHHSEMARLVPCFELTGSEFKEASEVAKEEEEMALFQHNDSVDKKRAEEFALTSSSGSERFGGVCGQGANFVEMLKRYCEEILPELIVQVNDIYNTPQMANVARHHQKHMPDSWFEKELHISSDHRSMKRVGPTANSIEETMASRSGILFDSYFDREDYAVALRTKTDASNLQLQTNSWNRLLDRLENRGHAAAPFVEGLMCELLPFQQQSLQWAVERETTTGGIERLLWSKLPLVTESNTDVYYNPVLGKFSTKEPNLVRGGIIAEQMGLGKTVISLALILRNPAPILPYRGSHAATIPVQAPADGSFWDPNLYARTSGRNAKRGSIISRGTLVVCNVSLVGQWIEEAKSKLRDPGLVYSYHGHGRKRFPEILATNAIVVTTYETLSSDATFHAAKSGDPNYCPPCEQVRWWRVMCDESHVLRGNNNKSSAVLDLVADNKWLVSGTPVNTTVMDLTNQLKFLGIEHASEYMKLFKETTCIQIGDKSAPSQFRKRQRNSWLGKEDQLYLPGLGLFSFVMRSIMMRHAHGQKYAGTNTTLMSLPPKSERTVVVKFSKEERLEYASLEQSALSFYKNFKATVGRESLSKHYLLLTQKLNPLRIACSGGQIPLDEDDDDNNEVDGDRDQDLADESVQKGKKKETQFSDVVFSSKLNALVGELTRVREQDTTAKSLVFSQYGSTLKYLQMELPKHGFQYRTLSGDMSMAKRAKALRDFQNDPPTRVFLLSMRAGAVGINLTQANSVFIMEPCFNPALEMQAIGRVHRLGQKRSVDIVRLTMESSVEGRIHKMLDKKYGSSVGASVHEDSNEEDKKPAAKPDVAIVCITADKTSVLADEFDLLFGDELEVANDTLMPDVVGSTTARVCL